MLPSTHFPITFVLGLVRNSSFGGTERDPEAQVKSIALVKEENRVSLLALEGKEERVNVQGRFRKEETEERTLWQDYSAIGRWPC